MTLGAMAVAARRDRPFSTQDLWLISTVAMQAAVVLTNSRFFGLLRQGKEEWETTFDALSEGIALVDGAGRITRAHLFVGLRCDLFITMTHADGENASKEIEILFSIDVVEIFSLSPVKNERLLIVIPNTGD